MNGLELNLRTSQSYQPQYLVRLADGVIEDANDAFLRLFGYQRDRLGSLQEAQVFEKTCLFAAEADADHWVPCQTQAGPNFVMEKMALELRCGDNLYSVVTLWETTLQEKVLNRLRLSEQIFATALDGIIVTDNQGIIQYVNPAFIQLSGYAAEELVEALQIYRGSVGDRGSTGSGAVTPIAASARSGFSPSSPSSSSCTDSILWKCAVILRLEVCTSCTSRLACSM